MRRKPTSGFFRFPPDVEAALFNEARILAHIVGNVQIQDILLDTAKRHRSTMHIYLHPLMANPIAVNTRWTQAEFGDYLFRRLQKLQQPLYNSQASEAEKSED